MKMNSHRSYPSFSQENTQSFPFGLPAKADLHDSRDLDNSNSSTDSTQGSDNNSNSTDNFTQCEKKSNKADVSIRVNDTRPETQMAREYASEIFFYLRMNEEKFMANPFYIQNVQNDITENMRAILLDWLVDVHLKFELVPETLFMTVSLIDRFLSKASISRKLLQLVGVSALLIASKFEEVYLPEVVEYSKITERAFSVKEILNMEGYIIATLEFELTFTSAHRFLERYAGLCNMDDFSINIAKYLIELGFLEYKMIKYSPSMIACSALYLTLKVQKICDEWPEIMVNNSFYTQGDLICCATDLLEIWRKADKIHLSAIRRKFGNSQYNQVSRLALQ